MPTQATSRLRATDLVVTHEDDVSVRYLVEQTGTGQTFSNR
jgi:hypothetical protein